MRTTSTIVGLILFALTGGTAGAQEAAAPAAPPAPPGAAATPTAPAVAAPAPPAAPAPVPAPAVAPAPAAAGAAPAPVAPAAAGAVASRPDSPPSAPAARRRLQVGLSFLPMGRGKYIYSPDTVSTATSDASFAYGVGISVGYEILPHLVVGVAPQAIFNVKEKAPEIASDPVRQYDLMARVAYVLSLADATELYAEVLPGYSLLTNDAGSKGVVLGFGVGGAIAVSERVFVNLGAGYQVGFQSWSEGPNTYQTRTRYIRVALGGGVKF